MFMVFAHLFNNMHLCSLCSPQIYIGDNPLVYLLIFAMNPVDFFIFLSGYGLYIAYQKGSCGNMKRVFRLYIHYWLVLFVFVSIGFFMNKEGYPGNMLTIIENALGWRNTYNHETWFIFPYSMLALTSYFLFKISDKLKPIVVFCIFFSIYMLMRFLSRYDGECTKSFQLYKWINSYFTLLFPFVLGMLTARLVDFSRLKQFKFLCGGGIFLILLNMAVIILLRNYLQSIVYPFYVSLFVILFVVIRKPLWLGNTLEELGKRSTSIWFVHTFLCYYLFQDVVYALKYPLIIFLVLMIVSYVISILIDSLYKNILLLMKL